MINTYDYTLSHGKGMSPLTIRTTLQPYSARKNDSPEIDFEQLFIFTKFFNISPHSLHINKQIHSNTITDLAHTAPSIQKHTADVIITNNSNHTLATYTADCLPIVLWQPNMNIRCLLHVGFTGLCNSIIPETISYLASQYSITPHTLQAYIGPGIEQKEYSVFTDKTQKVPAEFKENLGKGKHHINNEFLFQRSMNEDPELLAHIQRNGSSLIDIKGFARFQLEQAGITNIHTSPHETFHNQLLHSYRRDHPKNGWSLTFC